jgi:hypothetical protein
MLKIGDKIKCADSDDAVDTMQQLEANGAKTEFIYEQDGQRGIWLEVIAIKKTNTKRDKECVNDDTIGSVWGTITTLENLNEAVKARGMFQAQIEFCGILNDWNGNSYSFFKDTKTEENYFVELG